MENRIKILLIKALEKRFKAQATIDCIEDDIIEMAQNKTFEKYKDKTIFKDNIEFELIKVVARFENYDKHKIEPVKVELRLGYFCKSKLPKRQKEVFDKAKAEYIKKGWMHYNTYKIPIWLELVGDINIDKILSDDINLRIE